MINLEQLDSMKLGDKLTAEGYEIERRSQKNGKLIWTIRGWDFRSAKQVISWIKWHIKQTKKFGNAKRS